MAKDQNKGSSGANPGSPDGGAPLNSQSDNAGGADAMPQLNENAFAGLRQKIEQKLKTENETKQRKSNKKDNNKDNKDKNNAKKAPNNDVAKKEPKEKSAPKSGPKQESNKGKKQGRNVDTNTKEDKKRGEKKDQPKSQENDGNNTLRQEILALGGTQDDFDLLANVESESEAEGAVDAPAKSKNENNEKSLRNELTKILDAAGHVVPDDIEDGGDEDDQDQEDITEDEESGTDDEGQNTGGDIVSESQISDVEEEVPEPPPAPASKAAKEPVQKDPVTKEPPKIESFLSKEYSKLAILPRPDWYSTELPSISSSKPGNALPRYLVDRVHQYADSLLETENKMYSEAQQASNSTAQKFYSTIMSSGTLSDKISALTLAVQESPLHNAKSMETLINLARKRSRAQAVEVLGSLKDMFAHGTVLPGDRRLRSFANQPTLMAAFQGVSNKWSERDPLPGGLQKSHLVLWAFEHYVKDQYFEVLKILEVWCNDEIEFSRSRAVSYVYELLKEKPEQEANLLRLLVNKLGDRSRKVASRASYLILQLEQAHPLMKPTIITSIEELLFRPGQSQHAKYYAIITLNQTVLSLKEEKVAAQLLDIYFALFVVLLKPVKNNKAQPNNSKDAKFAKSGKKNKNDKGAANAKGQTPDEEMRDKLTSGVLTGVNRAYPFTNSDSERLSKHIDTLFRITHSSNFNTSIQALMLIQQLTSSHKVASDRFYRTLYESLLDPRVATSSKQALYLNLLYKSLKNDLSVRRVKAFVKRIVQVLVLHQPSFTCGIFYMIRELEKTFPGLQSLFDEPPENEDDEEEVFKDVPDEDDEKETPNEVPETKSEKPSNRYDPRKRDPEHSNADKTCLWELLPYLCHFHPSVSVNANCLLQHQPISGKPDLTLHTLMHFLDRFVYRSPKASAPVRGVSLMQPLAGGDSKDRLVTTEKGGREVPVNSEAFWRTKAENVAAEDAFFHEYFNRVSKGTTRKDKKTDQKGGEAEEDDEAAIWKALVNSRPELEADEDSDDDLEMSDLESAYDKEEDREGGDEDVIFNDESDEDEDEDGGVAVDEGESKPEQPQSESKSRKAKAEAEPAKPAASDDEEEEPFDLDDEAILGSDEELPVGMDVEPDENAESKEEDKSGQKKKRKLKHLPTFASADDYAALLADEDEGM